MSGPTSRVLQLLSLLQTHRFWSGAELAERLEVSARTLRRDVERLRELGYPVDAIRGIAGGYRLASGAHMPPLLLDDDEAVAIAVGMRAAASASVGGIEDTSLRALAKLEQVLPDRLRRRVNAIHANVVPLRWAAASGPTIDAGALALLAQACRDHEAVRFDYQRRDGDETRRLVEPHHLVSAGRRWYLVAFDLRRAAWRTFRLDRLEAPQLAGARFARRPVPGGDAAAFVARSMRSRPMAHEATIVAHGSAADVRAALPWPEVEVGDMAEGTCRVRLRAESLAWLASCVAMMAVAFPVEVEDSPELVARLGEVSRRLQHAGVPAG